MQRASSAADFILDTNKNVAVMAWGGFLGSDPIITATQLANLVKEGKIRYFLVAGTGAGAGAATTADLPSQILEMIESGGGAGGAGGFGTSTDNTAITQWITTNCSVVAPSQYETSSSSGSSTTSKGFGGAQQLYDCAAKS
jgi:hypothetical protein